MRACHFTPQPPRSSYKFVPSCSRLHSDKARMLTCYLLNRCFFAPPSADAVAAARAAWEPQVPANNPFGRRRPAHVVANGGESVVDINVSFFSFF